MALISFENYFVSEFQKFVKDKTKIQLMEIISDMEFVKPNSSAHTFLNFTENSSKFQKLKIAYDDEIALKFWID